MAYLSPKPKSDFYLMSTAQIHTTRIESLDYLRGLMALSIMAYHYTSWASGELAADSILGKLGIYAVSVFYILSGLSLSIVYKGKLTTKGDLLSFLIKRVFRIFPLFWIVTSAVLFLTWFGTYLKGEPYHLPIYDVILNYTLLFGFINPLAGMATGAWSIGNEMVFYVMLPLIMLAATRRSAIIPISFILSVIAGLIFSFHILSPSNTLSSQWAYYINPFNQVFLFLSGVLIGYHLRNDSQKLAGPMTIGAIGAAFFIITPGGHDPASIVTGINRVLLSSSCIAIVAAIYMANPTIKSGPKKILISFGEGCYSIYLLHPIVGTVVAFAGKKIGVSNPTIVYSAAFVSTLLLSYLTYKIIEKPMIGVGKDVSAKLLNTRSAVTHAPLNNDA